MYGHNAHMSNPIIDQAYLSHVSVSSEPIRKKGCTWIVDGIHCSLPCAPFLYLCNKHKDIPDISRHVYSTASSCKKRK